MIRVVIDTSVWVSGIFWHGKPHRVLQAWRAGELEVVVSTAILDEIGRVLTAKTAQFGTAPDLAAEWLALISQEALLVEPQVRVQACRDANDDKFLEAALAGRVTYLVSGDADLTDMSRFQGVEIVTPARLLECLRETA